MHTCHTQPARMPGIAALRPSRHSGIRRISIDTNVTTGAAIKIPAYWQQTSALVVGNVRLIIWFCKQTAQ